MSQDKAKVFEMDYVDIFGDTVQVRPKINMYANNNNLYVGLDGYEEEYGCWDPYCDVTVNVRKLPFLESAIDTNNNPRMVKFLVDQGFGTLTDKVLPSGFCVFPVFRFNEEKLKEIDPEMFSEYSKAHGKDHQRPKALDEAIHDAEAQRTADSSSQKDAKEVSDEFKER